MQANNMKAFFFGLLLLLAAPVVFSDELADRLAAVPNPRVSGGWVADPAGVIANRSAAINQLIAKLERETTTEIAVVVLPTLGELVPKDFAVSLVQYWGVGKAGKDNGVLVLHILDQRYICNWMSFHRIIRQILDEPLLEGLSERENLDIYIGKLQI